MKNRLQKFFAALLRSRRVVWARLHRRHAISKPGDDIDAKVVPATPDAERLNPLEGIITHLRRRGLGQKVTVRFEPADDDFILEDADGSVHAKDYNDAVAVIERIWLYPR